MSSVTRVVASAGVCAVAWLLTRSGPAALALALGAATWGAGRRIAAKVLDDFRAVSEATAERQLRAGRNYSDELLDDLTHDPFRIAREALYAARSRAGSRPGVEAAVHGIERVERDLLETSHRRRASEFRGPDPLLGGLAHEAKETHTVNKLYGDPVNAPQWVAPIAREFVMRAGRVLDDVRMLHTADVEWSVLLFTLWARASLVCLAPILGPLSFVSAPLHGGVTTGDIAWLAAATWSAAAALAAPWVVATVMERSSRGARLRRALLMVEVPVACMAALTTPAWMVVTFAAGWINWWQRQWNPAQNPAEFSWRRHVAFVSVTFSTMAIGLALASVSVGAAAIEIVLALAAIGIIGGSYGAMLPLSASVFVRIVVGGLAGRRRGERRAAARVEQAISDLLTAANEIENDARDDAIARRDAVVLRDVARQMRLREDLLDRVLRHPPRGLESLLEDALRTGGRMPGGPAGERLVREASLAGDEAPVTFVMPSISPKALRSAKLANRAYARALRRVVVRCALEARAHGAGPVETLVRLDGDYVVLRIANEPRGMTSAGRSRGEYELDRLVRTLPRGEVTVRGIVDSRFVEGTGAYELFGVEVRFSRTALEDVPRDGSVIIRA